MPSDLASLPSRVMATQLAARPETLAPEERYFTRELSWLRFNERVLDEGRTANYPLLERLRFLSISGSNLDEFIMIRLAGLVGQVQRQIATLSLDGRTPAQQLAAVRAAIAELERKQQMTWRELSALLAEQGIHVADEGRVDAEAARWLREYYITHVAPVITPQAIDPAHPFPFIANQGIGLLFNLTRLADDEQVIEMVMVPSALPRFVRVPGDEALYISIENQ